MEQQRTEEPEGFEGEPGVASPPHVNVVEDQLQGVVLVYVAQGLGKERYVGFEMDV